MGTRDGNRETNILDIQIGICANLILFHDSILRDENGKKIGRQIFEISEFVSVYTFILRIASSIASEDTSTVNTEE